MTLNTYLSDYFLREVHHMAVHGTAAEIYRSICNFDMSSVPWIKNLFRLRTVLDKTKSNAGHLTLRDAYQNGGFILLEEIPDQELTVGAIGKIWRPAISFNKSILLNMQIFINLVSQKLPGVYAVSQDLPEVHSVHLKSALALPILFQPERCVAIIRLSGRFHGQSAIQSSATMKRSLEIFWRMNQVVR